MRLDRWGSFALALADAKLRRVSWPIAPILVGIRRGHWTK
jgi:hypothetical protein